MGNIKDKVSYLKGLFDGMGLKDDDTKKLITAIIDVMDTAADTIEENASNINEIEESIFNVYDYLNDIDEELAHYDLYDDDDYEDDDDMDDYYDSDTDFVEICCPNCNDTIYFDNDMLENNKDLICPACNKNVIVK